MSGSVLLLSVNLEIYTFMLMDNYVTSTPATFSNPSNPYSLEYSDLPILRPDTMAEDT